jgi:hypothetical protein
MVVFAALAAGLFPATAAAQPLPEDPDRPTLRIGPFDLRPRLLLNDIGIDNNVFNELEDPKSDFTFTAVPDLELGFTPGRLKTTFQTATEFVYFRKYSTERSINRSVSARAELDLSLLRPFVSFGTAHTSARAGNEVDLRVRRHPRSVAGGARVLLASRTSLTLSVRRSEEEYDPGIEFRGANLAASLDSRTVAYEGAIGLELTPLTTVSLAVVREETRFDKSPLRDADSFLVAPTVTFSPLGLLSGTASLGYRRFEGRDASLPRYTGLTASGTLRLFVGSRYRVDTVFTRDVRYSYDPALPYYVVSGARATLIGQVAGPFDVRIIGGRESLAYRAFAGDASPGKDTFTTYGGGVGYRIAERLHFVVAGEFIDRGSALDLARTYSNHRIYGSLNWGASHR